MEEGIIQKSVRLKGQEVTDEELVKINKFTISPLTKEEVFTFKLVMGDNGLDDRNFEPFNLHALKDLKKLYIGKTMIKDHNRKADNQIARIYDTELQTDSDVKLESNEEFTTLVAKCYMIKTESNKDLIAEIKAGIKKEVSTSCVPKKAVCSICGKDNMKEYCSHYWGREYDVNGEKKICYFTLDGAKEAYEVSFVAVPAQVRAGTTKSYIPKGIEEVQEDKEKPVEENVKYEESISQKIDCIDSFLFIKKKEDKHE